jgi:hypothetical protein
MQFETKSRYAKSALLTTTDARGRSVTVVLPPPNRAEMLLGYHQWRQGEKLDHLAARYLNDAHGYWRICAINDAMTADALAEQAEIAIPGGTG